MPYKLKRNQPEFDVVDGPYAGMKFRHGMVYDKIPKTDLGRFESTAPPAPSKPSDKKNAVSEADKTASVAKPTKGGSKQ